MEYKILKWNDYDLRVEQIEDRELICLTDISKVVHGSIISWKNSIKTKKYLSALAKHLGKELPTLIEVRQGGNVHEQGTWVHYLVAQHFCYWCSLIAGLQFDNIINLSSIHYHELPDSLKQTILAYSYSTNLSPEDTWILVVEDYGAKTGIDLAARARNHIPRLSAFEYAMKFNHLTSLIKFANSLTNKE